MIQHHYFDLNVRSLPPLQSGDTVRVLTYPRFRGLVRLRFDVLSDAGEPLCVYVMYG